MAFWILAQVLPGPMSAKQAKQPNKQVHKVCHAPGGPRKGDSLWQWRGKEHVTSHLSGPMVVWLSDWDPRGRRSIPETTDFLNNSAGRATNALMYLFTKS